MGRLLDRWRPADPCHLGDVGQTAAFAGVQDSVAVPLDKLDIAGGVQHVDCARNGPADSVDRDVGDDVSHIRGVGAGDGKVAVFPNAGDAA